MENIFECARCGHTTNKKSNMIVHLNKKKQCIKRLESLKYSDDEIFLISTMRKNDKEVSKNKCIYCNKNYSSNSFLQKHIKFYCKKKGKDSNISSSEKEIDSLKLSDNKDITQDDNDSNNSQIKENIIKNDEKKEDNIFVENQELLQSCDQKEDIMSPNNDSSVHVQLSYESAKMNGISENLEQNNTIIENQHNTYNTINNNIYIINLPKMPISFDQEWDTKHIDMYLKQLLLLTDNKYTELLKQILENKNNLNVILDKNSNMGYVYDSDNNYKNMEKDEIVNLSMKKLHDELNKIKDEVIQHSKIPIDIENQCNIIESKYKEFINDKNIKNSVNGCISDIFDKRKEEALEIFHHLNEENNNMKIENDGY